MSSKAQSSDEPLEKPQRPVPNLELESLGAGVGYVGYFRNCMARIIVEGVRHTRDGLRGEVRVESGPYGANEEFRAITSGRMELTSMSQRETWERRLRKRAPGTDWEAVLDQFCAALIEAEKRLDKPAILLRDAPTPPALGNLLDPLVIAGMPTLWYGDGGTAKSYLALAAALSLQTGIPIIGGMKPPVPLRVLYADFEFYDWEHKQRMKRLLGFPADAPDEVLPEIAYLDCSGGSIVTQIDRIRNSVKMFESQFLVVDSISYAAEGPLNDDETARLYYRALGYIGIPSLSMAHVAKNSNQETPFGSVHWKNLSRLAWHFQVADSSLGSDLVLKLTNMKFSTGQPSAPLGLTLSFEEDGIKITESDVSDQAGYGDPLWKRVRAILTGSPYPLTYEEVSLALGASLSDVKVAVSRHRDQFLLLDPAIGSHRARLAVKTRLSNDDSPISPEDRY